MPGKFINEITGDTPAKDDLAVFFDKSKNSTAQATIAEIVNAGLDLAAGAKGQVPTIDVKVDAATSSLVNILTWGAGGGVDFKGTPTRPPTGTDEILTNDPANGLIGKTTLQQLVVAGGATILQPGTAVNTALVWNDTAGKWEPARAVSEAKNINGGAAGELPFQLNTHVTAWIPLGNAGQVLTIGDIGTAGNSFIAPMWNDPVKELPTFTIADKGKQLTVKADGKATEWVEDAKELPTIGTKGQVLTVGAGVTPEWKNRISLSNLDIPSGSSLMVTPEDPAVGYPHTHFKHSSFNDGGGTVFPDFAALTVQGYWMPGSGKKSNHLHLLGANNFLGDGGGVSLVMGLGSNDGSSLVHDRPVKMSRITCELNHRNDKSSRLFIQTNKPNGDINNGLCIWSNGSITVGYSTVAQLTAVAEADSFYALGVIKSEAGFEPPTLADTAAANKRIYFSTTANKLVYKDSAGVVHPLYT